jgi:hypothetical protein
MHRQEAGQLTLLVLRMMSELERLDAPLACAMKKCLMGDITELPQTIASIVSTVLFN